MRYRPPCPLLLFETFVCLCFLCFLSHTSKAPKGQQFKSAVKFFFVCLCFISLTASLVLSQLNDLFCYQWWSLHCHLSVCIVHGVDVVSCCCCLCLWWLDVLSSFQARVESEILDYKNLAALPKVKAIYEVQQPDLIFSSYQPYHRYTSDDRLDTCSYGEVLATTHFKHITVMHSSLTWFQNESKLVFIHNIF